MRIVAEKTLKLFWESGHARAKKPLQYWILKAREAEWDDFIDMRKTFASVDYVSTSSGRELYVFNIGGNNYRLIASVHFRSKIVFIRHVMTHDEYDENEWNK